MNCVASGLILFQTIVCLRMSLLFKDVGGVAAHVGQSPKN